MNILTLGFRLVFASFRGSSRRALALAFGLCGLLLCSLRLAAPASHAARREAAEPSATPTLRIETGMHADMIQQISVDAANRYVVTGSLDKTARVWELSSGHLLQTLRPPIDESTAAAGNGKFNFLSVHEGEILSVAISPDGRAVACGGKTGYVWDHSNCVYLFDRADGHIVRRLSGLPETVTRVQFSPDGRYLVAACASHGLRVYQTSDYAVKAEDKEYDQECSDINFAPDGRLITASKDGWLRLYDADFLPKTKLKIPGEGKPSCVRFAPDGKRIAVGYFNVSRVDVLAGDDLSLQFSPDTQKVGGTPLSRVAWSADGDALYAGWQLRSKADGTNMLLRWDKQGKGKTDFLSTGVKDTLFDLRPLQSGGLLFASGDPAWGFVDAKGVSHPVQREQHIERASSAASFLLSENGQQVQFLSASSNAPALRFDAVTRQLEEAVQPAASMRATLQKDAAFKFDLANPGHPALNGTPLDNYPAGQVARTVAISMDKQKFALGLGYSIIAYSSEGKYLWQRATGDSVWKLNISGDGKLCVALCGDGTLRWYRMTDGRPLLTLFPHPDRKRWIAWTPTGYYACSPGGEDLIGWHLNRGKEQAADFVPASRFRNDFYRPEVIALVLKTQDEAKALQQGNADAGRRDEPVAAVDKRQPPVVRIVSDSDAREVTEPQLTLKYALRSPSGEPITEVKVLIDGRPAAQARRLEEVPARSNDETIHEVVVPLTEHESVVQIYAANKFASSASAPLRVTWKVPNPMPPLDANKPRLFILAVGVGKYDDGKVPKLTYPAKDATDFTDMMLKQKGKLYRDVEVHKLVDEHATRKAILHEMQWIEEHAQAQDIAIIFMSGHGHTDKQGDYYVVPCDCDTTDVRSSGVPHSEIQRTIQNIRGKVVFFLDTCYAGVAAARLPDVTRTVNQFADPSTGAVVFAASRSHEESLESPEWHNGAFTKALMEGLSGKAFQNGEKQITIKALDLWLDDRVQELTHKKQHSCSGRSSSVPNFALTTLP